MKLVRRSGYVAQDALKPSEIYRVLVVGDDEAVHKKSSYC